MLSEAIRRALPNRTIDSVELLQGGLTNKNYAIRVHGSADNLFVLRIYACGPPVCAKEIDLLKSASPHVPVPEIIYADAEGQQSLGPYVLYRFADGVTFQQLKAEGNVRDMAAAARAIGAAAARIQLMEPPCSVPERTISFNGFLNDCLASPILEERLGHRLHHCLADVVCRWEPQLRPLYENKTVVHGDLNNRNVIVQPSAGGWTVSAILDWELAYLGSPLWDAARFLCNEKPERPCREPDFSEGFRQAGGILPENWTSLCRVINTITAAEGLTRTDLPEPFIPELVDLVETLTTCWRNRGTSLE